MSEKMTADEAIQIIYFGGFDDGRSDECTPEEQCKYEQAETRIREAFAIADRAREELALLEAQVNECLAATKTLTRDELADSPEHKLGWIAAQKYAMLKRIIDGDE